MKRITDCMVCGSDPAACARTRGRRRRCCPDCNHRERWKPISGFEEFYAISDRGRVFRYERWVTRIHTRPYLAKAGLMTLREGNDHGHLCVMLYDEHGQRHKRWVHRLVAEHFIPNPDGLPFVLHGVEGASVNWVTNLRWGDHSENEKDKLRHKLELQRRREESL